MSSSSETFDYWSLLGLSPGSDTSKLKEAFVREAKRWHPDKNKNDRNAEERFKWINEAYLVLSDPRKKFEWEVAGRPEFEIQKLSYKKQNEFHPQETNLAACPEADKSPNPSSSFKPIEILTILLISSTAIILLNAYIL